MLNTTGRKVAAAIAAVLILAGILAIVFFLGRQSGAPPQPTITATLPANSTATSSLTPNATITASATATPSQPVCDSAGSSQELCINPATVAPGGQVQITGIAGGCNSVTIVSNAFGAPPNDEVPATSTGGGNFSANVTIPAATTDGDYTVTARACGGNLGVQETLTVSG